MKREAAASRAVHDFERGVSMREAAAMAAAAKANERALGREQAAEQAVEEAHRRALEREKEVESEIEVIRRNTLERETAAEARVALAERQAKEREEAADLAVRTANCELDEARAEYDTKITDLVSHSNSIIASISSLWNDTKGNLDAELSAVQIQVQDERRRAEVAEEELRSSSETVSRLETALSETDLFLQQAQAMARLSEQSNGELQGKLDEVTHQATYLRSRTCALYKRNDALRKKVERHPASQARAVSKALEAAADTMAASHEPAFALKHKGVVPDSVRELVRDLVVLGVNIARVNKVVTTVASAGGLTVNGSFSTRTASRAVGEAGIASAMQAVEEIRDAECKPVALLLLVLQSTI